MKQAVHLPRRHFYGQMETLQHRLKYRHVWISLTHSIIHSYLN